MQQMLEKLFTWKYFEPTLFVTIGVLLLLLFIVFFVGNKDKKQKDGEATGTTDTPAFDDVAPVQDVAIPEPVNEIKVDEVPSVTPAVEESPIDNDLPPVIITDTPEIKPIDSVEISGNASSELPDEVPLDENDAKQTPEIPAVVTEEEPEKEEPDFEVFGNNEEKKPAEDAFGSTPEEKEIDIPPVVVAEEEPDLPPITVTTEAEEEKEEEPEKEETPEEVEVPDFKESFNELASSISKELDEISRLQNNPKSEIKKEKEEAKPIEIPNNIETTPLDDSKFTPSSVFSSVYIDKGEEDKPVLEEETEPDIPFFGQESSKHDMELPAMKEEAKEPEANDTEVNVPDFSAFDNETFNIK